MDGVRVRQNYLALRCSRSGVFRVRGSVVLDLFAGVDERDRTQPGMADEHRSESLPAIWHGAGFGGIDCLGDLVRDATDGAADGVARHEGGRAAVAGLRVDDVGDRISI